MFQVAQSELDSLFLYLNLFFSQTEIVQLLYTQKSTKNLFANRNTHCHFKNLENLIIL